MTNAGHTSPSAVVVFRLASTNVHADGLAADGRLLRQENRNIVHNEYSFGGDRLSATSRETDRPRGDAVRMTKSMRSNEHGLRVPDDEEAVPVTSHH